MRSLEDWISTLLYQGLSELNGQYTSSNYGAAEKEVESLPEVEPPQYAASRVDTDLLQKMHLKIREQKCEREIWGAIIFHTAAPLPIPIAHDLIDRDIVVSRPGHTRQEDEIQ